MHFAAWLVVADSVRDPIGYYRNNVAGALATLEAMAAERCRHFIFSSTCAVYGEPVETPIRETHPTAPINAYGQTKLAIEHALPHFERAYGHPVDQPALFQRGGRGSRRRAWRGSLARDPRHSARVRGGVRRRADRDLRRGLPDARRHLPARLHPRDRPGRRARPRADAGSKRTAPSASYNVGTERPSSVRDVIASVERVTGRSGRAHVRAARRPGDPAVLFASAQRIREDLGWTARRPELDTIVADAWRWHSSR